MSSPPGATRAASRLLHSEAPLLDVFLERSLVRPTYYSHASECFPLITLTITFLITPLVFSGNWTSKAPIAASTDSKVTTACVEPDSFGYVDETGKEHIAKITAANKEAVYGALEKGDVAALRTVVA